jgi:Na+-driven multidrug efflux pump
MFGSGFGEETDQLWWDIVRISLLCVMIVPAAILPWVKYACKLFSASDEIINDGFKYIAVTLGGSVCSCLYMGLGGCLQGEGRSLFLGITNVGTAVLNMVVFDPLLILKTSLGVQGAAIATVLSEGIPMLVILFCYLFGKFSVKPKLSGFLRPFHPRIKIALKVGLSQLIAQLSFCVPGMFMFYYVGNAVDNPEDYSGAMASLNVMSRYSMLSNAIVIAFTAGYIPSASYAYAHEDYARWIKLGLHLLWLNILISVSFTLLGTLFPEPCMRIFSSDSVFLRYAVPMLRFAFCGSFLNFVRINGTALFQTMQLGIRSSLYTLFSQFAGLLLFMTIYWIVFPKIPERYQLAYPTTCVWNIFIFLIFGYSPLKKFLKKLHKIKEKDSLANVLETSNNSLENENVSNQDKLQKSEASEDFSSDVCENAK